MESTIRRTTILAVACLFSVLPLVPPASADAPLPPPANLRGLYDHATDTVSLTWDPPIGGGAVAYEVYRGAALVDTVAVPAYTDVEPEDMNLYFVRAIDSMGGKGLFGSTLVSSLACWPVHVGYTPTFPFVNYEIYPECIGQ